MRYEGDIAYVIDTGGFTAGADGKGGDPSLTEADIRAVLAYLRAAFGS